MKKIGLKFVECIKRILVSNWGVMTMKIYEEVTVEEALKRCGAKAKVLVAIDDMEDDNTDVVFVLKRKSEYKEIFEDVKTVASLCDDFMKQLRCFTEKQDLKNIKPIGKQKIVLLE